jgi:hypothetical protein
MDGVGPLEREGCPMKRHLRYIAALSLFLFGILPAIPEASGFGPPGPWGQRALRGIFEPEMIAVAGEELYVVEGAQISVFSLKDLAFVRTFGRKGEGPGEFKEADFWYNTVTVLPDAIFVDGYDKVAYFSKDGRFLREAKKSVGISQVVPFGKGFVASKLDHLEGDVQYQCLYLLDANLKHQKELARQESWIQAMGRKTEMIPDVLNFSVWGDRLFVEKSREGFVIDVIDVQGTRLSRIESEQEKIPVTRDRANQALEEFKTDPYVKRMGFEKFKSFSEFVWPKVLPPIRDFTVADGKIFVRTSKTFGGKESWVILDLKGRPVGRTDLPRVDAAPLMAHVYGVHYYAVAGGKLYFLKENAKTDEWELFVEEIKEQRRNP